MDCRQSGSPSALAIVGRAWPLEFRRMSDGAGACARREAEDFIAARFAERYGARVRHFMPELFSLFDAAGALQAAVGLRIADRGELFLERYLDRPVESDIERLCGVRPARARIAEIGNLAARGSGQARQLIVALTDLLMAEGYEWVVFTATAELANSFSRLSLTPLTLGCADPARIGEERDDWGSYYDGRPRVMAGSVRGGYDVLSARGLFNQFGYRPVRREAGLSHVA